MAQRWSLEIKVGAFVVSGLALFIFFIFAIGDLSTAFQPGYQLRVLFDSANGITDGSPVQYAGVEVGKVQTVQIVYPKDRSAPKVELLVRLPSRVSVRADDEASISTFGLLGEKYLDIRPGAGQGPMLEPEGQLVGKPPVSTDQIIERSNEVLTEFKQTLQGLNSLVASPEARIYLQEAMREARDATRNWKALGERLNVAMSSVESGEGTMGRLLFDDELYQRMVVFVEDLRANPWKLLSRPKQTKKNP
ncbi:MAG: MCE family protein [Candidatus Omnitrophica bacterium]|nr:MCE family protein [Candidatus Omnitrophota bacterium]